MSATGRAAAFEHPGDGGAREEAEEPFSEGEPDLVAPEEAAIEELGDEEILGQELEDEELLEEDVEEDFLEESLEELELGEEPEEAPDVALDRLLRGEQPSGGVAPVEEGEGAEGEEEEEEESTDGEPAEVGLDEILDERLAVEKRGAGEEEEEEEEGKPARRLTREEDIVLVAGHGPGEFVCQSCFLVKRRELLADAAHGLCRDCVG